VLEEEGEFFFSFLGGVLCFFLSFLFNERGKRYASSISFSLWFCPEMKRERERERERERGSVLLPLKVAFKEAVRMLNVFSRARERESLHFFFLFFFSSLKY